MPIIGSTQYEHDVNRQCCIYVKQNAFETLVTELSRNVGCKLGLFQCFQWLYIMELMIVVDASYRNIFVMHVTVWCFVLAE